MCVMQLAENKARVWKSPRTKQRSRGLIWFWPAFCCRGISFWAKLTTDVHLVPRLRMNGAVHLLPLYTFRDNSWCRYIVHGETSAGVCLFGCFIRSGIIVAFSRASSQEIVFYHFRPTSWALICMKVPDWHSLLGDDLDKPHSYRCIHHVLQILRFVSK